MVLVDILEENGNDEEITDEIHTVDDYDEDETMSTMTINHHHVFYI